MDERKGWQWEAVLIVVSWASRSDVRNLFFVSTLAVAGACLGHPGGEGPSLGDC